MSAKNSNLWLSKRNTTIERPKKDKAKLELDKAVLFSIEAKSSRDDLQKKLDSLNRDLQIKNAESETIQSQIDQFRTENESVLSEYEEAQKNFYAVGAEIAKSEANLQNINKNEKETKSNLEKVKQNYEKAKETEKNFEELSPSEKAMHILDSMINTIEKYRINNENIREKTIINVTIIVKITVLSGNSFFIFSHVIFFLDYYNTLI